jgi:hypothetical protein
MGKPVKGPIGTTTHRHLALMGGHLRLVKSTKSSYLVQNRYKSFFLSMSAERRLWPRAIFR